MKRILFLLLSLPAIALSQTGQKISEMPVYIGDPAGAKVPVVINGVNRAVDANLFGLKKMDSISVTPGVGNDTIYMWKTNPTTGLKQKASYTLTRVGVPAGGPGTTPTGLDIPYFDSRYTSAIDNNTLKVTNGVLQVNTDVVGTSGGSTTAPNVAVKDAPNTFTADQTVNGNLYIQSGVGRVFGFQGLASGHDNSFQFGDASNAIKNVYGQGIEFTAFNGVYFTNNGSGAGPALRAIGVNSNQDIIVANNAGFTEGFRVKQDFNVQGSSFESMNPAGGVLLTSPNGSKWRLKVDNAGTLSVTAAP